MHRPGVEWCSSLQSLRWLVAASSAILTAATRRANFWIARRSKHTRRELEALRPPHSPLYIFRFCVSMFATLQHHPSTRNSKCYFFTLHSWPRDRSFFVPTDPPFPFLFGNYTKKRENLLFYSSSPLSVLIFLRNANFSFWCRIRRRRMILYSSRISKLVF